MTGSVTSAPTSAARVDPRLVAQLRPDCEIQIVSRCPAHGDETYYCEQPATWVLRTPCVCGATDVTLICHEHAEIARGAGNSPVDGVVICAACGAPTPPDRVQLERI